jgi:hypothetical protein
MNERLKTVVLILFIILLVLWLSGAVGVAL